MEVKNGIRLNIGHRISVSRKVVVGWKLTHPHDVTLFSTLLRLEIEFCATTDS